MSKTPKTKDAARKWSRFDATADEERHAAALSDPGVEPLICFALCLCYYLQMKSSEALDAHRAELRRLVSHHGLARPRVFGSVLRGTGTDESDLDLLVDVTEATTLFTLARLEHAAQELLGVGVSVLMPGFLPAKFRDRVLEQAEPL